MSATTMMIRNIAKRSLAQAPRLKSGAPSMSVGAFRFASHFTYAHEYAFTDGKIATVGITEYAENALGDVVFIDLPEVGDDYEKGDSFGSVESVKAASDVYAPVSGTVVEINEALVDDPAIVNGSAEDKGWFIKIEMDDESELSDLLTPEAYKKICGE